MRQHRLELLRREGIEERHAKREVVPIKAEHARTRHLDDGCIEVFSEQDFVENDATRRTRDRVDHPEKLRCLLP